MAGDAVDELTEAVVALIRREVPKAVRSGRNWKIIINGSAAGDIRIVVEEHAEVVRRFQPLIACE